MDSDEVEKMNQYDKDFLVVVGFGIAGIFAIAGAIYIAKMTKKP